MNRKFQEGVEGAGDPNDPKKLDNWHVDEDFFVHFLDSPQQELLVISLFSDVVNNGGATRACPEGIGKLVKWLMDHLQGVIPRMRSVDWPQEDDGPGGEFSGEGWYNNTIQGCSDFREMTGVMGDVILMHPFMLHSASRNLLRTHRIIINPLVSLYEPFNLDRSNPSVVELKTLKGAGGPELGDWTKGMEYSWRTSNIDTRLAGGPG